MKIVFATNNSHKLEEIRKIAGSDIQVLSLSDIDCYEEIAETGNTLRENALIKARYVHDKFGYDCFADDTGLQVEALGGAPGIYSARYAGEHCNPEDNMAKILRELIHKKNRSAKFKTVIALVRNSETFFFEGSIKGRITYAKRGENGFGYDPVFQPDGFEETFAEIGCTEKNKISHRALAVNKLIDFLSKSNL